MPTEKLNLDPAALGAFDAAADPAVALAAFDQAAGVTCLPPGTYRCRLEAGELTTTKSGKAAYRLRFAAVEPAEHAGFVLWRYLTFDRPDLANRAKAALAPLGLRTSADLQRAPFPAPGRTILCDVLVGLQRDDPTRNDVIRFVVVTDTTGPAPTSPFAVDLAAPPEGGQP